MSALPFSPYVSSPMRTETRRLGPEDRLVAGSLVLTLVGVGLGAALGEPAAFGITALVVLAVLLAGWGAIRTPRLGWLLVFGLVVGILELWADWLHVVHLESLVYTHDFGFRILASPSYMPAGWWLTAVQFGYLALRLADFWPRWKAVAAVSAAGMLVPPLYEEAAAPARAWHYVTEGPMLSNTPLWIVGTYGGCMFFIAAAGTEFYQEGRPGRAVVGGAFAAAGIMLSGAFFFWLAG